MSTNKHAPGQPGTSPTWSSIRKDGVGTACTPLSQVWFTIGKGILNEIYYPRIDSACTRDMEFVVTDGGSFFAEEKRDTESTLGWMAPGVPAFHIVNRSRDGRFEIIKEIITDPDRHVLLQMNKFNVRTKAAANESRTRRSTASEEQARVASPANGQYHLYLLLAPHLGNEGFDNTAWFGDYKGVPMLFAQRNDIALAVACSAPWLGRSAGFVGVSDGWQDLNAHKKMTWTYEVAERGNVALTAEIDLRACQNEFLIVVGFGNTWQEAAHRARASLIDGFQPSWNKYRRQWEEWHGALVSLEKGEEDAQTAFRMSASILLCHEAKDFPGGTISSLSIPWSMSKGGREAGGYHLVWPRDSFQAASAMLAIGAPTEAARALRYLEVTQEADGHWARNMWIDGTRYGAGIQLDEVATPLLLIDLARREKLLAAEEFVRLWPMVRNACGYLLRNGPAAKQDRWEEQPGFSPYTLAISVAALLSASDLAERFEPELAEYLRQTADLWNDTVESWTYVTDTALAKKLGVDGYYQRIAPADNTTGQPIKEAFITETQTTGPSNQICAAEQVSPDALALVRFGLRRPDDPRILNTVKVIDATLKVETPHGPCWHRFNGDGYGEQSDGSQFTETGIGRAWPLLTGERGHYEIAAGNLREARRLLQSLRAFAGYSGMIPEQIWDTKDIPQEQLFLGKATGSARPLVWAHAEHIKLVRSLRDERVFDMPVLAAERYAVQQTASPFTLWRFTLRAKSIARGQKLRIETMAPAQVHWTADNWLSINDQSSCDSGLGIHVIDLPTQDLPQNTEIIFTFFWPQENRWEGEDFSVRVLSSRVLEPIAEKKAEVEAMHKAKAPRKTATRKSTRSKS